MAWPRRSGLVLIIEVLFKFGALASVQHRGKTSVMASSSESEDKRRFFTDLYAKKSLKYGTYTLLVHKTFL